MGDEKGPAPDLDANERGAGFQPSPSPDPAGVLRELLLAHDVERGGTGALEVFNLDLMGVKKDEQEWQPVPHTGRLVCVSCCSTFLYGYTIAMLNPLIAWLSWDLKWCDARPVPSMGDYSSMCWLYEGLVVWMVFVGAACGSIIAAKVLKSGRRSLMIFTMWLHILGSLSFVTSGTVASSTWARFLSGLAVGFSSVIAPIYLSEMTSHNSRGLYGLFSQVSITLGILAANLLGLPLPFLVELPSTWSDTGAPEPSIFLPIWWRVIAALPILPACLCLYGLVQWFPYETPHYYLRVNKVKEAQAVLQRVYSRDDVAEELEGMAAEVQGARASARASIGFRQALKRADLRKTVIVGCILSALQQLTGINVFVSGSTEMLRAAGWYDYGSPVIGSCVIWALNVFFTVPSFWFIGQASRKLLIIVGCAGMALSLGLATLGYWVDLGIALTKWGALVGICLFVGFFATTYGPILWIYIFEIFPVEIKGTSFSLLTLVSHWIACVLAVALGRLVTNKWVFTVFACINLAVAILAGFIMTETKRRESTSPYVKRALASTVMTSED